MRRGTTPTHEFTTDINLTSAEVLFITYKQGEKKIIEKDIGAVDIAEDKVTTSLTQEETLKVKPAGTVKIQIRARLEDGSAVASNIMTASPEDILKDGVI